MDRIVDIIIGLVLIIGIGALIFFAVTDNSKYIYECTDYKGDIVYCTYAQWTKGGMRGTLEDGTVITITSYKQVLKEEVEDE